MSHFVAMTTLVRPLMNVETSCCNRFIVLRRASSYPSFLCHRCVSWNFIHHRVIFFLFYLFITILFSILLLTSCSVSYVLSSFFLPVLFLSIILKNLNCSFLILFFSLSCLSYNSWFYASLLFFVFFKLLSSFSSLLPVIVKMTPACSVTRAAHTHTRTHAQRI